METIQAVRYHFMAEEEVAELDIVEETTTVFAGRLAAALFSEEEQFMRVDDRDQTLYNWIVNVSYLSRNNILFIHTTGGSSTTCCIRATFDSVQYSVQNQAPFEPAGQEIARGARNGIILFYSIFKRIFLWMIFYIYI